MTIYDIKRLTAETSPYFFSRESMKFFNQTMRMFSVKKQTDGRYKIEAGTRGFISGQTSGLTPVRYFNPTNNQLEAE